MIEVSQGELKVKFEKPVTGKVSLKELGLKSEDVNLESGNLRLVFDFEGIGDHKYFQVPTIEVAYVEEMAETHWICDFNGVTILDKLDHHGHSTVMLLNRKTLADLEQRHENALVLHAEFPKPVHLDLEKSFVILFQ